MGRESQLRGTPERLTAREQDLVAFYIETRNATEAARRAGYKHPNVMGPRVIKRPRIAQAIERVLGEALRNAAVTKERIVAELALLAFSNMADYTRLVGRTRVTDLSNVTREQMAAVAELTVEDFKDGRGRGARDVRKTKLKLAEKRAALSDLAKLLGYVVDRHELSGAGGGPVKVERVERVIVDPANPDGESVPAASEEGEI
jgi:phage terminase small subunit